MSKHPDWMDPDVREKDKVLFEVTHRQVIGEVVEGDYAVVTHRDAEPEVMMPFEAAMYLIARNASSGVYEFPGVGSEPPVKQVRVTVEFLDA